MSQVEAKRFIEAVGASPALQAKVASFKGAGVLRRIVALGAEQGFHFDEDGYRAAVVELAEGELSDAALDEVLRETGLKS